MTGHTLLNRPIEELEIWFRALVSQEIQRTQQEDSKRQLIPPPEPVRPIREYKPKANRKIARVIKHGKLYARGGYHEPDGSRREVWKLVRGNFESTANLVHKIIDQRIAKFVPKQTWIYLVRFGDTDSYKIGVAIKVQRRINVLQMGTPVKLHLTAKILGSKITEREIHTRLIDHHVRGEWFNFTDPQIPLEIFAQHGDIQ